MQNKRPFLDSSIVRKGKSYMPAFNAYMLKREELLNSFEIVKIRNGSWELQRKGKRYSMHSMQKGAERMLENIMYEFDRVNHPIPKLIKQP